MDGFKKEKKNPTQTSSFFFFLNFSKDLYVPVMRQALFKYAVHVGKG